MSKAHPYDRAHPAAAGPENVQYRAVFIQFLRTLVPQSLWTESNPWLTHDTVEPLENYLAQLMLLLSGQ
jgi:hypothetical protein